MYAMTDMETKEGKLTAKVDAEPVVSWTSIEDEPHRLDGLLALGTEYALVEIAAPDGYVVASPVRFTVMEDGTEQTVLMVDAYDATEVVIHKRDVNGNELAGATLQVTGRETGAETDIKPYEWVSDAEKPKTLYLRAGSYVLHELTAPTGYQTAADIAFTVSEDGIVRIGESETDAIRMDDDYIRSDLEVSKVVEGNMGDKTKAFTFRLTLTRGDIAPLPESLAFVRNDTEPGTAMLDENGSYEFTLAHGEKIRFIGIPYGTRYEVLELDGESDGYVVSGVNTSGVIGAETVSIVFTNTKNRGIPTGFAAYTGITAAMMAILVLAFVLYFGRKRRNRLGRG